MSVPSRLAGAIALFPLLVGSAVAQTATTAQTAGPLGLPTQGWRFSVDTVIAIVSVGVSLLGWAISYLFTVRAQRKQLRDVIMNKARLEVAGKITSYKQWLSDVDMALGRLACEADFDRNSVTIRLPLPRSGNQWDHLVSAFHDLVYSPDGLSWGLSLEEHEILFPESKKVLLVLDARHGAFWDPLADCSFCLDPRSASPYELLPRREQAVERARALIGLRSEQMLLMQDLAVHLQTSLE